MKFRNQFLKYALMDQAKDDTGASDNAGGGNDDAGNQDAGNQDAGDNANGNDDLLKEVMKKKGKIKELETLSQAQAQTLEQFKGVDVELYNSMMKERTDSEEAAKQAEEQRLLQEGKFEEVLASKAKENEGIIEQMRTKHKAELEAAIAGTTEVEGQKSALLTQIEELTVGSAFGNSKTIREDLISAMTPARVRQLYGKHFEPNEKGEVIGFDKPKGVEGRAPIVDSQGNAVSFDEALKTILTQQGDIDSMLKNKVAGSGSGTQAGNGSSDGGTNIGSGIARISHALNAKD